MTSNNAINTYIVPTSSNEVTQPAQPAFSAYFSSTASNVTGDGTIYYIVYDTELFDQNSDYNSGTGDFTAPVTGKYVFFSGIEGDDFGAANTYTQVGRIGGAANAKNGGAVRNASNVYSDGIHFFVSLAASDTFDCLLYASGGGKVVDCDGSASPLVTYFGGYLVV